MKKAAYDATFSPFRGFTRDEWSKLEDHPMFPVSDIELTKLQAMNEPLTVDEMEKIYSEGMESGELKAKKETALSLAEMGLSVEKIAKAVNHNVNEVQKWIDENLCAIK